MKIFKYSKLYVIVLLVSTLVLLSCGTVHTSNSDIIVKKEPSSLARFLNVKVDSTDSGTLVSGTLEGKGIVRKNIPGHVDVVIVNNNSESVSMGKATLERVTSQPRYATFSVILQEQVPPNSTVLVTHHLGDIHE